MSDTEFNFFGIIKKCSVLLDLDEPTTFEDTEETEYKKLKNVINAINRSIILSEVDRWTFRDTSTTLTLDEGVFSYDRPNGMITSIIDSEGTPIQPEYAWNYIDTTITGLPNKYNVYGEHLLLNPTPSVLEDGKIYVIKYSMDDCAKNETGGTVIYKPNLELETDFSIIPTQFSDALVYGACRDYKAMPDRSKYQHYNARFTQEIRQMRKALKRSIELEPYFDTGGGRSNQDSSNWVDNFFNSWQ